MGCSSSMISTPDGGITKPKCMSTHQKTIILKTWKLLAADLHDRGIRIFLWIFQLNPAIKELFRCSHLEGDDLLNDATFVGHATRFMQAVAAVMDDIDDYNTTLSPLLNGLGRAHSHYKGFKCEYFDVFEEGIMHVWSEDLCPMFSADEVMQSWQLVFRFIMAELKCGYQDAMRDAESDNISQQQVST